MRLVLIGLTAGFFSALFGVGGGIVIVPLLVLAVGFDERPAAATSLAAIGLTALADTIFYAYHGRVEVVDGVLLGIPAAGGAVAGAALQQRLPRRAILLLFSAVLVAVAVRLLLQ